MESTEQYDCLLDLATKRRSVRQFKSDPGRMNSSPRSSRWRAGLPRLPHPALGFVVIKDPQVKAKIVAALDEHGRAIKNPATKDVPWASFRDAPVFIPALSDWRARSVCRTPPAPTRRRLLSTPQHGERLHVHEAGGDLWDWPVNAYGHLASGAERAIREIVGIRRPSPSTT